MTRACVLASLVAFATMSTVLTTSVEAAPYPPHNTETFVKFWQGYGYTDHQNCDTFVKHGNAYAVGYAQIRRDYAGAHTSTSSSTQASWSYPYYWGGDYNNLPPGVVRCKGLTTIVTVSWNGQLLEYSNENLTASNPNWVHAQGPTYSSLVGSTGYVSGNAGLLTGKTFPGI